MDMSNSPELLGLLKVKQEIARAKEIIYFGDSPEGYPLEFSTARELEKLDKARELEKLDKGGKRRREKF